MKLFTRELAPVNDPWFIYNFNAVLIEEMQHRPTGFKALALLANARDQYRGSAPVILERSIDSHNRRLIDGLYDEYGAALLDSTSIDNGHTEQLSYMVGTHLPVTDAVKPVRVVELHGRSQPGFRAYVAPLQ